MLKTPNQYIKEAREQLAEAEKFTIDDIHAHLSQHSTPKITTEEGGGEKNTRYYYKPKPGMDPKEVKASHRKLKSILLKAGFKNDKARGPLEYKKGGIKVSFNYRSDHPEPPVDVLHKTRTRATKRNPDAAERKRYREYQRNIWGGF